MNQIEKEHTDEDLDVNDIMNRSLNDAASSVDSRMGDTPSNYNIPNQRYDAEYAKLQPQQTYMEEDEDFYPEGSDDHPHTGSRKSTAVPIGK